MRRDVVNRIESVIKDLWPTARVSVSRWDIYMCMGRGSTQLWPTYCVRLRPVLLREVEVSGGVAVDCFMLSLTCLMSCFIPFTCTREAEYYH